jgi:hypothetical protein
MHSLKSGVMLATCFCFVVSVSSAVLSQDVQSGAANAVERIATTRSVDTHARAELPESPGAEWARMQDATAPQQATAPQEASTSSIQSDSNTQEKPQRPVGTAAAEAPRVTGITAAEPAGVAIAPAKQRRVRTIVLKVGAIVGAGAALGTVIALTAGTSSKPPGAH